MTARRDADAAPDLDLEARPPQTRAGRRQPGEAVSWSLRVAGEWSLRFLLLVGALFVLWRLLDAVGLVTISLVVALLVTALLQPAVAALQHRGTPTPLAVVAVFILGIASLGLIGWFVVTQVSSNFSTLAGQVVDAENAIREWLVSGPLHISEKQLDAIGNDIVKAINDNRQRIASGVFTTASTAIEAISGLLLVLVSIFFLLRDGSTVWRWVVQLFPLSARGDVHVAGRLAWRTLSGYVRGVVLVACADAVTVTIVLLIVRIPLAIALGVLIFVGAFVPLIGLLVTGTLCVLVALVSHGVGAALVVAIAIILAVQAEGQLLHPFVMSRAVRVHPLAVVISVTAGTIVAGIFGALIAVPVVAVANTIGGYFAGRRSVEAELEQRSELTQEAAAKRAVDDELASLDDADSATVDTDRRLQGQTPADQG
ncbi:MAG: AI-2E family transporter [Actinomycetes bacterium]